jgi:hypothetical protein
VRPLLQMVSGMSLTMPPLTTFIMSSVPSGSAGVGSAVNDTMRELGGALGVAVLGSLVSTRFTTSLGPALAGLSPGAHVEATSGLAGALHVAGALPSAAGSRLAATARSAFVDGLGLARLVAVVAIIGSAALAYRLLPRKSRPTSFPCRSRSTRPRCRSPARSWPSSDRVRGRAPPEADQGSWRPRRRGRGQGSCRGGVRALRGRSGRVRLREACGRRGRGSTRPANAAPSRR